MRKFEVVSKYKDLNIELPKRQTIGSAGYDLSCANDYSIESHQIVMISTGVKVSLNDGEVLLVFPRSSVPLKLGLILLNGVGVIDKDYYNNDVNEGEIFVPLFNMTDKTVKLNKGDRIAQGIFVNFLKAENETITTILRNGGFGSSGL